MRAGGINGSEGACVGPAELVEDGDIVIGTGMGEDIGGEELEADADVEVLCA